MTSDLTKRDPRDNLARIQGEHREPAKLQQWMQWASHNCHLVSPAPSVGALPEGFSVALSVVHIDAREMAQGGEVYDVGGKSALGKSALQRIAGALGLSWDPQQSRRLDDGSDPHYCHYRAVGTVTQFDGSTMVLVADKEMDLRDGAAQVEALWDRYRAGLEAHRRGQRKRAPNEPTGQIREMRLHILSHAQSKAQLRAIRSLGVRTSYVPADLGKPFVCARLMFTGQSNDPEMKRRFSEMLAAHHLGRSMLYGPPEQPAPAKQIAAHAPPPVGEARTDDSGPGLEYVEVSPAELPAAPPQPPAQPSQTRSALTVPGGREKGKAIADASDDTLRWWASKLGQSSDSRYAAKDAALAAAMRAELERRAGHVIDDGQPVSWDEEYDGP